jgi:hypothetical protein
MWPLKASSTGKRPETRASPKTHLSYQINRPSARLGEGSASKRPSDSVVSRSEINRSTASRVMPPTLICLPNGMGVRMRADQKMIVGATLNGKREVIGPLPVSQAIAAFNFLKNSGYLQLTMTDAETGHDYVLGNFAAPASKTRH